MVATLKWKQLSKLDFDQNLPFFRLEDGSGLYYYMLNSAEESNMRKVFDRAKMASWEDIVAAVEGKDYIIPTVGIATEEWSSQDFENTGKCNFYKIGGKFLFASFSMALKVMHSYAWIWHEALHTP